jgi:hypothetical protein
MVGKVFDNREAAAYLIFRRFNCSRDEALAAIDELAEVMPAPIAATMAKRWRSKRRPRAAAAAEKQT